MITGTQPDTMQCHLLLSDVEAHASHALLSSLALIAPLRWGIPLNQSQGTGGRNSACGS